MGTLSLAKVLLRARTCLLCSWRASMTGSAVCKVDATKLFHACVQPCAEYAMIHLSRVNGPAVSFMHARSPMASSPRAPLSTFPVMLNILPGTPFLFFLREGWWPQQGSRRRRLRRRRRLGLRVRGRQQEEEGVQGQARPCLCPPDEGARSGAGALLERRKGRSVPSPPFGRCFCCVRRLVSGVSGGG